MSSEIQPTILKFPTGQAVSAASEQTQNTQQPSNATTTVNAQSAAASKTELHKPFTVTTEVFLREFQAAVKELPQSSFDGTGKYDPREQALLAKLSANIDAQEALIDLNLSDKPDAAGVLEKVQQGLGSIPDQYRQLVSETVVKALQDNSGARDAFQNLIRYAKASTALLAEAKKANLSETDTTKLTNLLKQAQPFEGIFGVLVANTFDAAKKLDVKALVGIFKDYAKSLDGIVEPLVAKHLPRDISRDPLAVANQFQPGIQNLLAEYADQLAPVAQEVMTKTIGFVKENAGPLSKVFSNALAALSSVTNRLQAIWAPPGTQLHELLKVPSEQAAKASLN